MRVTARASPLCIGERNWLLEGQIPAHIGSSTLGGRSGMSCVICAVHAYLFPGGFSVNKPEIAFADVRYSSRQYNVYVTRTHP